MDSHPYRRYRLTRQHYFPEHSNVQSRRTDRFSADSPFYPAHHPKLNIAFEHALRLAISVGGDSDTLASITGAIAHAFYGPIPSHLLHPVLNIYLAPELRDTTLKFCEQFKVPF